MMNHRTRQALIAAGQDSEIPMKLGVGLYGANGHQIHQQLRDSPRACVVAFAGIDEPELQRELSARGAAQHKSLESLIHDPAVSLVSLCSPRRTNQPHDAILAMHFGKHVLAEKPAAMTLAQLEELRRTSDQTRMRFFEMGATALGQPAVAIRKLVQAGVVGTVVQVVARKSYPYHPDRPQDEEVDGGLILQCAIHGVRLVERASCSLARVWATETSQGNPTPGGGLRMASCLSMGLKNGAIATVTANYLNPLGTQIWGYDAVRVSGTDGMIEFSTDGRSRVMSRGKDIGPLQLSDSLPDDLETVLDLLVDGRPMPLSLEDQLHPTKVVLCAKASAERRGAPLDVE